VTISLVLSYKKAQAAITDCITGTIGMRNPKEMREIERLNDEIQSTDSRDVA
jgi:hypothetical protein